VASLSWLRPPDIDPRSQPPGDDTRYLGFVVQRARVEPRGLKPLISWLQISVRPVSGSRWGRSVIWNSLARPLAARGVAVLGAVWLPAPAEAVRLDSRCVSQRVDPAGH
jgi:hypothetical protein